MLRLLVVAMMATVVAGAAEGRAQTASPPKGKSKTSPVKVRTLENVGFMVFESRFVAQKCYNRQEPNPTDQGDPLCLDLGMSMLSGDTVELRPAKESTPNVLEVTVTEGKAKGKTAFTPNHPKFLPDKAK